MFNDFLEYLPFLLKGTWITISLSLVSVLLSILFGLAGAGLKLSDNAVLRGIGMSYTTLIRSVPDLVLMLILFFGGQIMLNTVGESTGLWQRINVNQFFAGSFSIGFIFGSYMAEAFRTAYLTIPDGQIDAAKAFGMRTSVWLKDIVWPQFVPLALPAFTNNWLILMKTTALVSIIGLQDLTFNALQAGRTSREPFIFLIAAFVIYLLLTLLSDIGLKALNRHYSRP